MKIVTFNINGIKARIYALSNWIKNSNPDVVLLQEIKSVDDGFPRSHFENMGYNVETSGQKSFNGVAILSKYPIEDINRTLPGDTEDAQARWIEANILVKNSVVRVCSLYAPNGNPAPGPKFDYKLNWMKRFITHAETLLKTEIPIVLGGDYNVIPQKTDAANPNQWEEDALFLPQSRSAFRKLLNIGYVDSFRIIEKEPGHYT
jgi:exodeoxyribonuclease-3